MRRSGRAASAALLAVLVLVGATAALAQEGLPTLTGSVTDPEGRLADDERARLAAALAEVETASGIGLHALYVPTTGIESVGEFAEKTADVGGLGRRDALLLVAYDDQRTALWLGDGLEAEGAHTEHILEEDVEPRLAVDDLAGAGIAAADALRALAGGDPAAVDDRPGDGGGPIDAVARLPLPVQIVGAVLLVAGYLALKRRVLGPTG